VLPWHFDFSDGQVPVTWVGARYRHIVLDFDLLQSLKEETPRAADLYIYFMTGFTNRGPEYQPVGAGQLTFHDGTPRQAWTALLRFLRLADEKTRPKTVDAARRLLDPPLVVLRKHQVLAKATWGTGPRGGVQLTVQRGPLKVKGNGVMVKITTIPKGARGQAWMGHVDFHDYTIQADVMGAEREGKLPDIGLIAQRYRLQMMGASQQLKLVSWVSHEKQFKTVPFAWKPNVWYTMKLRASREERNGRVVAVLRGKVWPRGHDEPDDWSIQWMDTSPNEVGSPGLFGNAKDAEIFIDNVRVTAN